MSDICLIVTSTQVKNQHLFAYTLHLFSLSEIQQIHYIYNLCSSLYSTVSYLVKVKLRNFSFVFHNHIQRLRKI